MIDLVSVIMGITLSVLCLAIVVATILGIMSLVLLGIADIKSQVRRLRRKK